LSLVDENGKQLDESVTLHSLLRSQDPKKSTSELVEIQQLPEREVALLKGHKDEVLCSSYDRSDSVAFRSG
jgi:vancomycin resistance protein YoaR